MKKTAFFIRLIIISFVLNFFWEMGQMFLYAPHTNGPVDFVARHILASLGDVVLTLLIFFIVAGIFKDLSWHKKLNFLKIFTAVVVGFFIAVAVEKFALASGRWAYDDLMPIIPFFEIGLSPVLQMVILPIVSIFFTKAISKEAYN